MVKIDSDALFIIMQLLGIYNLYLQSKEEPPPAMSKPPTEYVYTPVVFTLPEPEPLTQPEPQEITVDPVPADEIHFVASVTIPENPLPVITTRPIISSRRKNVPRLSRSENRTLRRLT